MRGHQTRGEIYKGSVPTLADSTDRFLDLDTKQSVLNLCDIWSSNIHHIMNEPSVGMYRIVEHVRTKVPLMVEQKNMLKTKKVNEKIYDADYAILACKSINTNTPWIFSDSIRILKNNFVSVPLVQQPNTNPTTRKQPRPTNLTITQPQSQQQAIPSNHHIVNPPPSSITDTTNAAISSSKSTSASEIQVATSSNKSSTVANSSAKSSDRLSSTTSATNNNTILSVANSDPLVLDEPKQPQQDNQEIITEQVVISQQETTEEIVEPTNEESTFKIQHDNYRPNTQYDNYSPSFKQSLSEQVATIDDPTESVPTLPTSTEHSEQVESIVESETVLTTATETTTADVITLDNTSPTSPQQEPIETVEVQGDEWSSLAIQPPSSTTTKKKKPSKKKKKKASADEDEELTPRTF